MSVLTFLLFKLNTLHKETLHWNYLLGKQDKMLFLNLIRFKADKKINHIFYKTYPKYKNVVVKWTLKNFKKIKWLSEKF